jgi:hypothetical protein
MGSGLHTQDEQGVKDFRAALEELCEAVERAKERWLNVPDSSPAPPPETAALERRVAVLEAAVWELRNDRRPPGNKTGEDGLS